MWEDDIRDCVCKCPPNRHLLVRLGSLAVVGGECVDCPCSEFEEVGIREDDGWVSAPHQGGSGYEHDSSYGP